MFSLTKKSVKIFVGVILSLCITSIVNADSYKPYGVKSGTISYDKLNFKTEMKMTMDANGNSTYERKQVPYVAQEIVFIWDNYGDVSLEKTYKVAEFGGKALEKKVLELEILNKDNTRYVFNHKKKKLSKDQNYPKQDCLRNLQECQKDGVFKFRHQDAKYVSDVSVAGKKAKMYAEGVEDEYAVWNNIVLKSSYYSYKNKDGKKVRFDIERQRVATKVDTKTKIDANMFNPVWINK